MRVEIINITPDIAAEMLTHNYEGNTKLIQQRRDETSGRAVEAMT